MAEAITLVPGVLTDPKLGDDQDMQVTALVQGTAGSILVYDGTDATGVLVLASSAVGVVALNFAVVCRKGLFVVLTGGATGSVLTD